MGIPSPPGAPSRRLPAAPESAALARRFVRSVLDGVTPEVADTAELLTCELATNAVLHARGDFEVRAWAGEDRVQVQFSDGCPERGLVPHDPHPFACTGRGLALVEELAPSHGVHSGADRKTVWFELWPGPTAPPTVKRRGVGPGLPRRRRRRFAPTGQGRIPSQLKPGGGGPPVGEGGGVLVRTEEIHSGPQVDADAPAATAILRQGLDAWLGDLKTAAEHCD